jgi:hypothetical protein
MLRELLIEPTSALYRSPELLRRLAAAVLGFGTPGRLAQGSLASRRQAIVVGTGSSRACSTGRVGQRSESLRFWEDSRLGGVLPGVTRRHHASISSARASS